MGIVINYETKKVSFYRFVCNDSKIKSSYVGHTVNFRQRKNSHKTSCNNSNNKHHHFKIYQIIRENGGWNEWCMIEIESRLVKDKREAERIEQDFINKLEADMNSNKAFKTDQEKCDQKAEYNIEYMKEYRLKQHNKDKNTKQQREFRLNNKEKCIETQRAYRLKNKDRINENRRLWKLKLKSNGI